MEKLLKNGILDNLYEIREGDIEKQYISKYGEPEEIKKIENAEKELVDFMRKFIKDKKDMQNLFKKLNQFELYVYNKMNFWYKPYYKTGFIDGVYLKKELKHNKNIFLDNKLNIDIEEDSFFYKCVDSVMQFIEYNRFNIWTEREDYKETMDKIEKIKDKYPKIRTFLEDEKIIKLTDEELKEVLEVISLNKDIQNLEIVETFKLGLKEGNLL